MVPGPESLDVWLAICVTFIDTPPPKLATAVSGTGGRVFSGNEGTTDKLVELGVFAFDVEADDEELALAPGVDVDPGCPDGEVWLELAPVALWEHATNPTIAGNTIDRATARRRVNSVNT